MSQLPTMTTDKSLRTKDGLVLFTREWHPAQSPQAVIVLVHGMGEHSGRHQRAGEYLSARGYAVLSFDLRGHGQSEGPRGHTPSYEHLLDDIALVLDKARARFSGLPLFLYGHSLGGNLVLNFALRRSTPALKGVIATSPWLRLAFDPPQIKLQLAKLMTKLWPGFSQESGLDATALTRNQAIVKAYREDPLVHSRISARMFQSAYQAGHWAIDHAAEFPCPLLLMHGSGDRITSWQASQEFAAKVPKDCTFKLWEGFFHELHHEPEYLSVFSELYDWLNTRTTG